MGAKIVFMRRTAKEIEIFGGQVYIDVDGKNIGILGAEDFSIYLDDGKHKIKMYKSHTYDTFIGFAEAEIMIENDNNLLIKYASPMLVNQLGNIIVSDYHSQFAVDNIAADREKTIINDYQKNEQKKQEIEEKSRNGIIIFVIIMVIIAILYGIEMSAIYNY